jgi:hypothetical protein
MTALFWAVYLSVGFGHLLYLTRELEKDEAFRDRLFKHGMPAEFVWALMFTVSIFLWLPIRVVGLLEKPRP